MSRSWWPTPPASPERRRPSHPSWLREDGTCSPRSMPRPTSRPPTSTTSPASKRRPATIASSLGIPAASVLPYCFGRPGQHHRYRSGRRGGGSGPEGRPPPRRPPPAERSVRVRRSGEVRREPAESVRAALAPLLAHPETAAIMTDFDGTLSSIVEDPEAARPLPGAAEVLARLAADASGRWPWSRADRPPSSTSIWSPGNRRRIGPLLARPVTDYTWSASTASSGARDDGVVSRDPEAERWRAAIDDAAGRLRIGGSTGSGGGAQGAGRDASLAAGRPTRRGGPSRPAAARPSEPASGSTRAGCPWSCGPRWPSTRARWSAAWRRLHGGVLPG